MIAEIIRTLSPLYEPFVKNGYQIYLVGGAVRDLLMGTAPKDFDFTTDALPQTVVGLFRRTVPTGIKHGTVTVMIKDNAYEVTTFRTEGKYDDHRKPSQLEFTPNLEEDLKRRDFTINALALALPSGEIIDYHQGRDDLAKGLIRAIGSPRERFQEDALRILRACRFAARLGFQIDDPTWDALVDLRQDIRHLSKERIREELNKIVTCSRPGYGVELLVKSGLSRELGMDFNPEKKPWAALDRSKKPGPASRWAYLIKAAGIVNPEGWMRGLCFSNLEIKEVMRRLNLVAALEEKGPQMNSAQGVYLWGQRQWDDCFAYLDLEAQAQPDGPWQSRLVEINLAWEAKAQGPDGIFLKDLTIQGNRVMEIAGKPGGPWLGVLMQELLEEVWKNPVANTPATLEKMVKDRV